MTIFVDTGVIFADHDTDAASHDTARAALETVYDGQFGQPYLSDYIYDESITLTRSRTGSFSAAQQLGDRLRGVDDYPRVYEFLHVSPAVFTDAIQVFEQYRDQELSFTDATTVAIIERHGIDQVLSFDDGFVGIVPHVDPADI